MSQVSSERMFVAVVLSGSGEQIDWTSGDAIFTLEATSKPEAQEMVQRATGRDDVVVISLASWKSQRGKLACPSLEDWISAHSSSNSKG